jgi:hypothetical protein
VKWRDIGAHESGIEFVNIYFEVIANEWRSLYDALALFLYKFCGSGDKITFSG